MYAQAEGSLYWPGSSTGCLVPVSKLRCTMIADYILSQFFLHFHECGWYGWCDVNNSFRR